MKDFRIGVHLGVTDASTMLARIVQADAAGLDMVWSTTGGIAPDPLVVLAHAASVTDRIGLGTSIVPTYPRHPLALAQSALALEQLSPGRLRLGIGASHESIIHGFYGIPFERPQSHLREYVAILAVAARHRPRRFRRCSRLSAHAEIAEPTPVPILAAALRPRGFQLCGEITDGAISWMCPLPYIRDTAAPALVTRALKSADRPAPPLVTHMPVVVSDDRAAVREGAAQGFGIYQTWPYYQRMMVDAGLSDATGDVFTDAMADALVISGTEDDVAEQIRGMRAFGASELLADISPLGDDSAHAWDRTDRTARSARPRGLVEWNSFGRAPVHLARTNNGCQISDVPTE